MSYQFRTRATMGEIETRVNDVFSMGVSCKMRRSEISQIIVDRVFSPLNARTKSGRRRHSLYLAGYASGLVDAWRALIWREHVEYCYMVDGELYSTHKNSARKNTSIFYNTETYTKLHDAPSAHYWKNSEKVY